MEAATPSQPVLKGDGSTESGEKELPRRAKEELRGVRLLHAHKKCWQRLLRFGWKWVSLGEEPARLPGTFLDGRSTKAAMKKPEMEFE